MDRELFVLLWTDDGAPQCALYEDRADAERDAALVGGRVEPRGVHRHEPQRTGRFAPGDR
jgi:hypothetical protein